MAIKQIQGLDQVIKSLRGLEPKIKLKFAKNATKAGAMEFKNKAKANAPKLTGALKRRFGVKAMKASKDIIGSRVVRTKGKERTKGQQRKSEDPFYWYFQEKGFYSKPGRFFVTKAFDSKKNQTLQAMENRIAQDVSKYRGN